MALIERQRHPSFVRVTTRAELQVGLRDLEARLRGTPGELALVILTDSSQEPSNAFPSVGSYLVTYQPPKLVISQGDTGSSAQLREYGLESVRVGVREGCYIASATATTKLDPGSPPISILYCIGVGNSPCEAIQQYESTFQRTLSQIQESDAIYCG